MVPQVSGFVIVKFTLILKVGPKSKSNSPSGDSVIWIFRSLSSSCGSGSETVIVLVGSKNPGISKNQKCLGFFAISTLQTFESRL